MPPEPRPLHLRPRAIALVALGGTVGTAARAAVGSLLGTTGPGGAAWPWATWTVNLTGALLLGLLLGRLAVSGADRAGARDLRLLAGTGVLGGYTTYSTLALDTVALAGDGALGAALLYAASTLVLGIGAAAVGMAAGARLRPPPRLPVPPATEGHLRGRTP